MFRCLAHLRSAQHREGAAVSHVHEQKIQRSANSRFALSLICRLEFFVNMVYSSDYILRNSLHFLFSVKTLPSRGHSCKNINTLRTTLPPEKSRVSLSHVQDQVLLIRTFLHKFDINCVRPNRASAMPDARIISTAASKDTPATQNASRKSSGEKIRKYRR